MILNNCRTADKDDTATLFLALCMYIGTAEAVTDRSLVSYGFGAMLELAERAASVVASGHTEEGDDWDGVLWYERLEAADEGSLAHMLVTALGDDDRLEDGAVRSVVLGWLEQVQ